MKHYLLLCLICFGAVLYSTKAYSSERKTLNMNTDWAFYRGEIEKGANLKLNDESWIPVVLPHVMQLEKKIGRAHV